MHDEDLPRRKNYPLSPAKMSKTPSWIMLGFVLGALFVVALRPRGKKAAGPVEVRPPLELKAPRPARQPQPLTTIEAVFTEWVQYAVWYNDTSEVALWNSDFNDFADFFEVRRFEGIYYFRSIPRLTRRVFTPPNLPPNSPLHFTIPEEVYREFFSGERSTPWSELRPPNPERGSPSKVTVPPTDVTPPSLPRIIPSPETPAPTGKK
jgi:hypothetical protein